MNLLISQSLCELRGLWTAYSVENYSIFLVVRTLGVTLNLHLQNGWQIFYISICIKYIYRRVGQSSLSNKETFPFPLILLIGEIFPCLRGKYFINSSSQLHPAPLSIRVGVQGKWLRSLRGGWWLGSLWVSRIYWEYNHLSFHLSWSWSLN